MFTENSGHFHMKGTTLQITTPDEYYNTDTQVG